MQLFQDRPSRCTPGALQMKKKGGDKNPDPVHNRLSRRVHAGGKETVFIPSAVKINKGPHQVLGEIMRKCLQLTGPSISPPAH